MPRAPRTSRASAPYAASIPNCCLTAAVNGDAMNSSSARPDSGRSQPDETPPEKLNAVIKSDYDKWLKIIRDADIHLD